ncbi:MAG: short-subunit dehydrogenase [Oleiphilaceae bacterium]
MHAHTQPSLGHERQSKNINVSEVCPALFITNLLEAMNKQESLVTKLMKNHASPLTIFIVV